MKKWLLALVLALPIRAFAALPSDTTWEVRTAGADANGGCYDTGGTGTDYSQQDAAQLSLTDLAQTLSSTTLTSATGGFTSAMVDNCIQITATGTGPFTLGHYEITAFTDSNTVTLDRTACSTANCSGGTGAVGGALDTPDDPVEAATHTIYIKSGTYNASIDSVTASNWTGYTTTRDDLTTGTNRPLIDCQSTRANGIRTDGNTQVFRNLRIANCTGDGVLETGSNIYWNVKSSSNSSDGWANQYANATPLNCFLCESASNTGLGYNATNQSNNTYQLYASYTHDNGGRGAATGGSSCGAVIWSVAETNGGHGFDISAPIISSVSHGNTGAGSDGFNTVCTTWVFNSAATSNADYGFSASSSSTARRFDYNGYNGNTTGGILNITAGLRDVTGAPNFTAPASGDFTINSSSSLLATGFPQDGAEVGLTGDYQANIGIDQDDNTAGGTTVVGNAWGF